MQVNVRLCNKQIRIHCGRSTSPKKYCYVDYRKYPDVMVAVHGNDIQFGHGGVLYLGPIMIQWTVDTKVLKL